MSRSVRDLRELICISRLSARDDAATEPGSSSYDNSEEIDVENKGNRNKLQRNKKRHAGLNISDADGSRTINGINKSKIKNNKIYSSNNFNNKMGNNTTGQNDESNFTDSFNPQSHISNRNSKLPNISSSSGRNSVSANETKLKGHFDDLLTYIDCTIVSDWLTTTQATLQDLSDWCRIENNFVSFANFLLSEFSERDRQSLIKLEYEVLRDQFRFAFSPGLEHNTVHLGDISHFLSSIFHEYPAKLLGPGSAHLFLNYLDILTLKDGIGCRRTCQCNTNSRLVDRYQEAGLNVDGQVDNNNTEILSENANKLSDEFDGKVSKLKIFGEAVYNLSSDPEDQELSNGLMAVSRQTSGRKLTDYKYFQEIEDDDGIKSQSSEDLTIKRLNHCTVSDNIRHDNNNNCCYSSIENVSSDRIVTPNTSQSQCSVSDSSSDVKTVKINGDLSIPNNPSHLCNNRSEGRISTDEQISRSCSCSCPKRGDDLKTLLSNVQCATDVREHAQNTLAARAYCVISVWSAVVGFYRRLEEGGLVKAHGEEGRGETVVRGKNIHESRMYLAIRYDSVSVVHYLLRSCKVAPSLTDSHNRTIVFVAVVENRINVLKYLLTRHPEIDVNLAAESGNTALHSAAIVGNTVAVELLLESGKILIDKENNQCNDITALQAACIHGNMEIVKLLLKAGADTMRTLDSKTAAELARDFQHYDIAQYIKEYNNYCK